MKLSKLKKAALLFVSLTILVSFGEGCTDADIASANLSKDADYFKILRRIVFYNGINGEYILEITGYCSLGNYDADKQLTVTCKTGVEQYKKNFLGLSDNVTYFAEQIESANVDPNHYEVIFKPASIIPDIKIK